MNSNPATIMTDPETADRTYIEPITVESVTKVIEKERPDALLPNMGGQTGLNCAVALGKAGILEKYGVEVIGCDVDSIETGEDRELFANAMRDIGLEVAKSRHRPHDRGVREDCRGARLPGGHPPRLHARRRRRRHGL